MCNHVHVYIANMKTMAKTLKCSQIQSQSIYFSKFSWGGMPLDPPSISHNNEDLRLITQLCVIICFWSASPIANCFPQL